MSELQKAWGSLDNYSKFERIQRLNSQIQHIEETVYPDGCAEVKATIIKALEERIDAIVEDRV